MSFESRPYIKLINTDDVATYQCKACPHKCAITTSAKPDRCLLIDQPAMAKFVKLKDNHVKEIKYADAGPERLCEEPAGIRAAPRSDGLKAEVERAEEILNEF